uniref:Uncharacterized protein n=2 Tax=Alexandrium monilatum TaxID=311494 RepID=A0A7S4QQF1_9DINO
MEHARLVYAGAPATEAHMAVIFKTTQGLAAGGTLELLAPEAYSLSCPAQAAALGLRGVRLCSGLDNSLRVVLSEAMAPGSHALVVHLGNPAFTPADNRFALVLRDRHSSVRDARMGVPGRPIVQGLGILASRLAFSSSTAFAQAEVRVSFHVATAIDPYQVMGAVRALQIVAPERFLLITREPVLNLDGLPTPETRWFHLLYTERLVRVDLVRSEGDQPDVIPAGDYRLSFQVRLPEFWMPNINIWVLSLCRNLRCSEIIADVAMAGFRFGDAPTLGGGEAEGSSQQGGAQPRHRALPGPLVACASVALAWLAAPAAPP